MYERIQNLYARFVSPGFGAAAVAAVLIASGAAAQSYDPAQAFGGAQGPMPALSLYGSPGHVLMPSAEVVPDGEFTLSASQYAGPVRLVTMAFQITPRLSGSFRYSYLRNYDGANLSRYDRSFDLRYLAAREDTLGWGPAIVIGLQDFGGTGIFGGEYIVASKHFGAQSQITASVGLGWGRYGSYGGFSNPLGLFAESLKTREAKSMEIYQTGRIQADRFFHGDAALFAGVNWQVNDRWRLSAEYSSDGMRSERDVMGYDYRTPINLGASYRLGPASGLSFGVMNGASAYLSYSVTLDPRRAVSRSGNEAAPPAVSPGAPLAAGMVGTPGTGTSLFGPLAAALADQGMALQALQISGDLATADIENRRWRLTAQAWGRAARVMSQVMPASVARFRIRILARDVAASEATFTRRDLEELEFAPDGAWQAYARADIRDAAGAGAGDPATDGALAQTFDYNLHPYTTQALFDPDNPLRMDLGAEVSARWSPGWGYVLSGALRQKAFGNVDDATRTSNSELPHVRSDYSLYAKHQGPEIPYLTAAHFAHPAPDVYTRLSFGLLEQMYGGVSGEVLWAPLDSRLALGLEANWVKQRDYDGIGFLDYSVWTGHASAYYDFGAGYLGELDVGRYLAGDWGATFRMARSFDNGFQYGAFFTLTDVGFDRFGEGSFDKGIFLTIPLSWFSGAPSQSAWSTTIRPVQRDGGARLDAPDRLYGLVQSQRDAAQGMGWGRFWR